LHANSPTRTKCTSAFCISSRSASQRDSGHCSGYHAVPRSSGGAVLEGEVCAELTFVKKSRTRPRQTVRQKIRWQTLRGFTILSPVEHGDRMDARVAFVFLLWSESGGRTRRKPEC